MNNSYDEKIPRQAFILMKETPFIQHVSHMPCGSYTSEWVARAIGLNILSANELLQGPLWHDYLRPIFPLTILKLLKMRGVEGMVVMMDQFTSPEQKIMWLKREIATEKKPVIILIKSTTLHWIVVCGYDDDDEVFYVYDPNFGDTSLNKDVTVGNKEVNYTRLLNDWKGRWNLQYTAVLVLNDLKQSDHIIIENDPIEQSG